MTHRRAKCIFANDALSLLLLFLFVFFVRSFPLSQCKNAVVVVIDFEYVSSCLHSVFGFVRYNEIAILKCIEILAFYQQTPIPPHSYTRTHRLTHTHWILQQTPNTYIREHSEHCSHTFARIYRILYFITSYA